MRKFTPADAESTWAAGSRRTHLIFPSSEPSQRPPQRKSRALNSTHNRSMPPCSPMTTSPYVYPIAMPHGVDLLTRPRVTALLSSRPAPVLWQRRRSPTNQQVLISERSVEIRIDSNLRKNSSKAFLFRMILNVSLALLLAPDQRRSRAFVTLSNLQPFDRTFSYSTPTFLYARGRTDLL